MKRLAVICLPFLAMACASAPEPASPYAGMPTFDEPPHPLSAGSCAGRSWDRHEAWQDGLPEGITLELIDTVLIQQEGHDLGCVNVAFAVRSHSPLEVWVMCEIVPVFTSFNTETHAVSGARIIVSSCDIARRNGPPPDPLNVINQDNTQERSE